MQNKRITDSLMVALALPVFQILNLAAYANTRQGWAAKAATIAAFLPIIALTTACWAMGWATGLWLVWRLFKWG
jgi:hypothetical protein